MTIAIYQFVILLIFAIIGLSAISFGIWLLVSIKKTVDKNYE